MSLESCFTRSWYGKLGWTNLLRPIQPVVKRLVSKKRQMFLDYPEFSYAAPVPVIIVGNISAGGTGKSPMVVALCALLAEQGYRPGVVSRGHGTKISSPLLVEVNSLAAEVGDEPLMLARRTACPVAVYPKRDEAVQFLLKNTDVNIIVSDDGMQHYRLNRNIEVAMLDANRGLGNGQLLPVGPLREPVERLASVDFVVSATEDITAPLAALNCPITTAPLLTNILVNLHTQESWDAVEAFKQQKQWHIIAGIGNPRRFLDTLYKLGLSDTVCEPKWFTDHHDYKLSDIPSDGAVIMTEKDAVKCQALGLSNENIWYLPISLALPDTFKQAFIEKLNRIKVDNHHE
ncbi:tetraacyldisaccharide 4'-kinase [Marinomonas sp.]|nr:tetraacyldisaccharide 4'-kinase [Marinomonas sp.]MDB4836909.1 tetraacyldisaccharide 4'-kinase [Marinomonas sp.]